MKKEKVSIFIYKDDHKKLMLEKIENKEMKSVADVIHSKLN